MTVLTGLAAVILHLAPALAPWIITRAFGHDFVESFLIFMALVNLHHFILDGSVWKLRDGRLARLLLGQRAPGDTSAEVALQNAAGDTSARHHLG